MAPPCEHSMLISINNKCRGPHKSPPPTTIPHLSWIRPHHPQAPYLLSVGNDLLDDASASLRVWALQRDGEATLVRSIRLFGSSMPEGPIMAVAVVEDSWPSVHLAYAVGKDGAILHISGDVGMECFCACVVLDTAGYVGDTRGICGGCDTWLYMRNTCTTHTHAVRERVTRAVLVRGGGGQSALAWNTLWWAGGADQLYAVAASKTCVVHVGSGGGALVCVCVLVHVWRYTWFA